MKYLYKSFRWLFALLAIGVTACDKQEVAPLDEGFFYLEHAHHASSSRATVYNTVYRLDLTDPRYFETNPCTGERSDIIDGVWHFKITVVQNRHQTLFQVHDNTSRYSVMDSNTGLTYVGGYTSNLIERYIADGTYEVNGTLSMILTTPGKGNNLVYKVNYHATFAANGEVDIKFDNERAECEQ